MQSYIADGDRTSVWFDMRYKNNGGASRGGGIAKRRYLEAQIFGLYEPGVTAANISQESALKVYQVLTKNRTTVFDYEHEFSSYIDNARSEEHTSELQSLMRSSYAVFCLKKTRQKRKQ